MLGAGLLAKKAVELGLTVKPYIKTSLSPGSGVVTYYLRESGVIPHLEVSTLIFLFVISTGQTNFELVVLNYTQEISYLQKNVCKNVVFLDRYIFF